MTPIGIERLRKQLYFLERGVRALRAELEAEIVSARPATLDAERVVGIDSPLEGLLSAAKLIAPVTCGPHEKLAPGIVCSYPAKLKASPLTVRAISFGGSANGDAVPAASCLIAEANFDPDDRPEWLSIETEIDVKHFAKLKSLDLKLVTCFRHDAGLTIPNFWISLRLGNKSGFKDHYGRSFPAMDVPLEFTYQIEAKKLSELPLNDAERIRLMIFLPTETALSYQFILSYFAMSGVCL